MGTPSQKSISGHGLVFGQAFKIIALSLIPVVFCVSGAAQTDEQLKDYSERVEFGTIEEKRDSLQSLQRFESEKASRAAAPGLRDLSPTVRATAIGAVVSLPRAEASALLVPFLNDRLPFIRKETAYALAKVRDPSTAPELIRVLKDDKKADVRTAAAFALGRIGHIDAVPQLAALLKRKPKSSRAFLRRSAARSIGQIAEAASGRGVTENTPENFLSDEYKDTASPKPPDPELASAAAVLEKVLVNTKEANDTRREAAFALGAIGKAGSAAVLRRFATDKDYFLAQICREALLKINDR